MAADSHFTTTLRDARTWVNGVYLLTILLVAALFVSRPVTDPDFWWHLKTGQLIAEARGLLAADPFNVSAEPGTVSLRERIILDGYWLWQIVAYGCYRLWDFAGIKLLNALTLTGTYLLLAMALLRSRVRAAVMLPLLTVSLALYQCCYSLERPQVISFAFAMLLVWFFVAIRDGAKPSPWLYPVMALWGNLHPAVIMGVPLLVLITAGSLWDFRADRPRQKAILLWCLGGTAASFLNPSGIQLYFSLWETMSQGVMTEGIAEYASTWKFYATTDKLIVLLWLLLLAHVWALWQSPWRRSVAVWLVSAYLGGVGLLYVRHVAFAALALMPLTGWLLEQALTAAGKRVQLFWRVVWVAAAGLFCVYYLAALQTVNQARARGEWGAVSHIYPHAMVNFLRSVPLKGTIFNDYDWGGYLLWALYPQYLLFIDGRGIEEQKFVDYKKINNAVLTDVNGRPEYEVLLDKYRINVVVAKNEVQYTAVNPLLKYLLTKPEWSPIYQDGHGYVLVKADARNMGALRQYHIDKRLFLDRLVLAYSGYIQANPGDDRRYLGRGELLGYIGRYDEAERDFAMVQKLNPGNPFLPAKLRQLEKLRALARDAQ